MLFIFMTILLFKKQNINSGARNEEFDYCTYSGGNGDIRPNIV